LLGHSKMKGWSVYIIRCRDRSLSTGFSTDVQRRFGEHISGGRNLGSGQIWVTPIRSVSAVNMLFWTGMGRVESGEWKIKIELGGGRLPMSVIHINTELPKPDPHSVPCPQ